MFEKMIYIYTIIIYYFFKYIFIIYMIYKYQKIGAKSYFLLFLFSSIFVFYKFML